MKPYYEEDGITIYNGDCREIAPLISADVIVSDPPYGVGKDYGACDDTLETFQEAVRLISSRSVPAAVFTPVRRILDLPVRPQWIAVWSKTYGASGLIAYPIYPHWEAIALYSFSGKYAGNCGHRSDVFNFAPAPARGSGHPTPKPLDLMKELVGWMPAGTVLDPYMGSGTTLVAAKQLGRMAVGIELEKKYCDVAIERLRQSVLPMEQVIPQPEQITIPL